MDWLSAWAVGAIKFYRRRLSPLKGYRCASGQAGAKHTCSAMGLRIFKKAGPLKGLALLGGQFDRCSMAASQARSKPMGRSAHGGQAGFVDCDVCVGGFGSPACSCGGCVCGNQAGCLDGFGWGGDASSRSEAAATRRQARRDAGGWESRGDEGGDGD